MQILASSAFLKLVVVVIAITAVLLHLFEHLWVHSRSFEKASIKSLFYLKRLIINVCCLVTVDGIGSQYNLCLLLHIEVSGSFMSCVKQCWRWFNQIEIEVGKRVVGIEIIGWRILKSWIRRLVVKSWAFATRSWLKLPGILDLFLNV